MIRVTISDNETEVLNRLRNATARVLAGVRVQMDKEMLNLRRYIVREKLSGQVLHHRSGTLIDSVQELTSEINGETVKGGVEAGGGPAFYGVYFEEGGKGPYEITPKNKKALAFMPADGMAPRNQAVVAQTLRGLSKGGSVKARAIEKFNALGGVVVKSVIHPPIPKLPFMGPSLNENAERIRINIRKAVIAALNEG